MGNKRLPETCRHTHASPWRLTCPLFASPSPGPLSFSLPPTMRPLRFLSLLFSSLLLHVSAQSTSSPANSTTTTSSSIPSSTQTPTPSSNLTTFLATSSYATTIVSHSGTQDITFTTVVPTVYNVTSTLPTPTASTSASPSPTPIVLATEITPAFGVLGAILILTGLPSAFWGHKNRWCAVSSTPHIQSLNRGLSGLPSSLSDFIPCPSFASFSSSNLASSQQ